MQQTLNFQLKWGLKLKVFKIKKLHLQNVGKNILFPIQELLHYDLNIFGRW